MHPADTKLALAGPGDKWPRGWLIRPKAKARAMNHQPPNPNPIQTRPHPSAGDPLEHAPLVTFGRETCRSDGKSTKRQTKQRNVQNVTFEPPFILREMRHSEKCS